MSDLKAYVVRSSRLDGCGVYFAKNDAQAQYRATLQAKDIGIDIGFPDVRARRFPAADHLAGVERDGLSLDAFLKYHPDIECPTLPPVPSSRAVAS